MKRLFVWDEFSPDYTFGLAFAIADNVTEAMELVTESLGHEPSDWGSVQEFELTEKVAFSTYGGG